MTTVRPRPLHRTHRRPVTPNSFNRPGVAVGRAQPRTASGRRPDRHQRADRRPSPRGTSRRRSTRRRDARRTARRARAAMSRQPDPLDERAGRGVVGAGGLGAGSPASAGAGAGGLGRVRSGRTLGLGRRAAAAHPPDQSRQACRISPAIGDASLGPVGRPARRGPRSRSAGRRTGAKPMNQECGLAGPAELRRAGLAGRRDARHLGAGRELPPEVALDRR